MPIEDYIKSKYTAIANIVSLRRQREGSEMQGKMGIKAARLGGRSEHQCEPGRNDPSVLLK